MLVFALLQGSTMYVCLRVLHWNFFLSAFLAAVGVGGASLAVFALRIAAAGKKERHQ